MKYTRTMRNACEKYPFNKEDFMETMRITH
jgi:hypothetical protein